MSLAWRRLRLMWLYSCPALFALRRFDEIGLEEEREGPCRRAKTATMGGGYAKTILMCRGRVGRRRVALMILPTRTQIGLSGNAEPGRRAVSATHATKTARHGCRLKQRSSTIKTDTGIDEIGVEEERAWPYCWERLLWSQSAPRQWPIGRGRRMAFGQCWSLQF
jgi:hypothetical protein